MYVQIGKAQALQITDIVAVIDHKAYVPAAFVRLLVPVEEVRSFVVTADYTYGSPYRAQAIVNKIKSGKL